MFKKLLAGVFGLALMGMSGTGNATVIDFDSYSSGTILAVGTFDALGVHFDQSLIVDDGSSGGEPGSLPNYAINNDSFGDDVTGSFFSEISFLSVFAGDSGGDTDTVTLNVYDVFDALVDSDTFTGASAQLLSVSGAGIVRFELIESGSIGFDDFTFTSVAVPEPATLSLFAVGLVGIGFAARRRRKAA